MSKRIGEIYSQSSSWQNEQWRKLVQLLIAHVGRDFHFGLDLGCGSGDRTYQTVTTLNGLDVLDAIDADASMIATARRRNGHPKIRYRHLDIDELAQLNSLPFDLVLANYSLHWIGNKDLLFQNLNKRTALDATIAIGTCSRLPALLQDIDDWVREIWQIELPSPFHYLDESQWARLLKCHGWSLEASYQAKEPHLIESTPDFFDQWWAASAGKAFYGRRPEELGETTLRSIKAKLDESYGVSRPGQWLFDEDTLLLVARRHS